MTPCTETRRRIPIVKALLLDLDGTVADTHELIFQCFSDTFRQHVGCDCSRPVWERSVGLPLEAMFAAVLQSLGQRAPSPEILARSYREHLPEIDSAITVFPGIPQALQALQQGGLRLAVVTSKHQPAVSRHLQLLKLAHRFEVVVTGDQCARCKPDPEPFARALAALGVSDAEAAGIGDSAHDVCSARAAGLLAVAACWGTTHRAALLSSNPDLVLEQPEELLGFLS